MHPATALVPPPLRADLVAVIVGDFDRVSGTRDGFTTSVYTPVGRSHQGRFALRMAMDAIGHLEGLFGVPARSFLHKSDLIAVPEFAAGAMENMGAVTYREAAVLIDENESSLATRQRVAQVVAHELSHMWFGNIVTMQVRARRRRR